MYLLQNVYLRNVVAERKGTEGVVRWHNCNG